MERKVIRELLDDDQGTAREIELSLQDLRHINDWFGGTRTTAALLKQIAKECRNRELSLLEIGAGHGDTALSAAGMVQRQGLSIQVTLLDRMWSHLPQAQRSLCGDALRLPLRDGVFDVVSCSLFAHHFEPEELRQLVSEALRVCRRAVLINDLIRSRLHLWLVYAGLPLFRSRITWHDAPASVRRAYTVAEMQEIVQGLPAERIAISRHYLYRMGVVVWKERGSLG